MNEECILEEYISYCHVHSSTKLQNTFPSLFSNSITITSMLALKVFYITSSMTIKFLLLLNPLHFLRIIAYTLFLIEFSLNRVSCLRHMCTDLPFNISAISPDLLLPCKLANLQTCFQAIQSLDGNLTTPTSSTNPTICGIFQSRFWTSFYQYVLSFHELKCETI